METDETADQQAADRPRLSIVVPVYNEERTIVELVDKVLYLQHYRQFELPVIQLVEFLVLRFLPVQ